MGWGRALFLGEIGNQLDIQDTERTISQLRSKLRRKASLDRSQDKRIDQLETENEELKLYMASLVRVLINKGVLSEAELESLVNEIDREEDEAP